MNGQGPEGLIFAGKYRITKLIGKGGMANVYLAVDMGTGMNVAVKILKPEFSNNDEFIKRFDTEARAVSSLNHANIVKVYGVGHEHEYRYIIQEYVEGITVKELINQNGHLDWRVAVPIAIQVGMAVEHAHRNGIVHRDIKPQNILINRERIAKITDFGIARAATTNTITVNSGGALGSVHYFSPEQARGSNVGPSSDIYSMGVMLFEMVTGRLPFDGDTDVEVALKHLQDKPPIPSSLQSGIPSGLDSIILKCMQKTPERRYTSMRQLVDELDGLMVDPNGVFGVVNNVNAAKEEEEVNNSFRQNPSYNKVEEFEKTINNRRRARFVSIIITVVVVLAIIGVLLGAIVLVTKSIGNIPQTEKKLEFTVEDYRGKRKSEVEKILQENNVPYEFKTEERDEMEAEIIIDQSIEAGKTIKAGSSLSKIILTYSVKPESFILKDYSDMNYADAQISLQALGLDAKLSPEITTEYEVNKVIRTEPPAGSSVQPKQSITLYYAIEPTSSEVPEILGMNLAEARLAISEAGLSISYIDGNQEVFQLPENEQIIYRTDPAEGTAIPRRSAIKVYVGNLEDYQRGGSPTPTPAAIKVDPGIEGAGIVNGAGEYAPDTTVTLTAVPSEGCKFDYWKDSLGNIVSYSETLTFTCTETNHTFVAVFSVQPTNTPTPAPTSTPTPPPTNTPTPEPTATPVPPTNTPTPEPADPNHQDPEHQDPEHGHEDPGPVAQPE